MNKLLSPILLATLLTSCATYQSGTTQKVNINSTPPGAQCNYSNELSSGVVNTPAPVVLERSRKSLNLNCVLPNYGQGSLEVNPGVNWWIASNITNLGIGYFYDVNNGSGWKYPEDINVSLTPTARTYEGNFMLNGYQNSGVVPKVGVPQVDSMSGYTQPNSQFNAGAPTGGNPMGEAMRDMEMMTSGEPSEYTPPNFDAPQPMQGYGQPMQQQPMQPNMMMPQQQGQPMNPQQYYDMLQRQRQMQQMQQAPQGGGYTPQQQSPSYLP